MKILVVGSGGREHALCWRLAKDGHAVLCAPGNPGIAQVATCVDIAMADHDGIAEYARRHAIELVVIGPEAPLVAGLADRLRIDDICVFGPGLDGARLEGSKVWAKQFFARHGIRTPPFEICATPEEADAAIEALGGAVVVKADGLAAGKGVVVAADAAEARSAAREMLGGKFGAASAQILVEKKILGREVSLLAVTDGKRYRVLPTVEDHKTLLDGDLGPNTGGMGTVSPAWNEAQAGTIRDDIIVPTLRGLRDDGIEYRGVLFAGVMVDEAGAPWLLEYNCRFGDPEMQALAMRLTGDFGEVLQDAARGKLDEDEVAWDERASVCVVIAAAGYPAKPRTGDVIGIPADLPEDVVVFHAGTAIVDGQLVTSGGRVLGVTAVGPDLAQARARAYAAVDRIELDGKQVRRDIGARGLR